MNRRDRITVLVSLHQVEYALRYCPRTIALKSGEVVFDGPSRELTPALLNSIYGAESEDFFLHAPEPANASKEAASPPAWVAASRAANADRPDAGLTHPITAGAWPARNLEPDVSN